MTTLQLLRCTVLTLVAAGALPVAAATRWACWYNMDQHVACVLHSAAPAAALTVAERQALEQVRPVRAPAWTRIVDERPTALQLLRSRPGALLGRTLFIPLFNEPFDHRSVAVLAQAVMCGALENCSTIYGERPAMTLEFAADFADANDPLHMAGE